MAEAAVKTENCSKKIPQHCPNFEPSSLRGGVILACVDQVPEVAAVTERGRIEVSKRESAKEW